MPSTTFRKHFSRRAALPVFAVLLLLQPLSWSRGPEGDRPQDRRPGPPDLDRVMEHLTVELDLTEEQATAMRPILEDQRAAMHAMREEFGRPGDSADREAAHERMMQIRQETEGRLSEILDEEQLEGYRKLRHRGMRHRRQGPGGGPPPRPEP